MMDIIIQDIKETIQSEIDDLHFQVGESCKTDIEAANAKIIMLQSRIESLKAKQDALWEKYAEGMPKGTFERLLSKNEADAADAAEALLAAQSDAESITYAEETESSLYVALDALNDGTAPAKEMNTLLKAIIKRITYTRQRSEKVKEGGNGGGWKVYEPELTIEFRI